MNTSVGTPGRLCNHVIRNICCSILAKKAGIKFIYSYEKEIDALGIDLYKQGTQLYSTTRMIIDSCIDEYMDPSTPFCSNIRLGSPSFFQTKYVTNMIYGLLREHNNHIRIRMKNKFRERYARNNDVFLHIRLGDVPQFNPGFSYYDTALAGLSFSQGYIASDSPDDPICKELVKKYKNIEIIRYDEVGTILFGSTCKYVILSHGSFSYTIGCFAFDSTVFYPEFNPAVRLWHGDMFSISGWICVKYIRKETLVTVLSATSTELVHDPQVKQTTLATWQMERKDHKDLIVQASVVDGSDGWQPFSIGMCWGYGRIDPTNRDFQIGSHSNLVFCGISIDTDKVRRRTGVNRASILQTLAKNSINNQRIKESEYFKVLPSYKFVISPEGNGIDCHRHYEALLAGCIPVIERHPLIEMKYSGLPILYTRDYSEITSEYLEKQYENMIHRSYDFSSLFLSNLHKQHQEEVRRCGNYWMMRHLRKKWY
jgi:hypothetical protein